MIRRAPEHRTVPRDESADALRRERRCEKYVRSLEAEPTSESLHDDGSLDGVAVRTLEECERERLAHIAELQRLCVGSESRRHAVNVRPCTLTKGRRTIKFGSVRAACEYANVTPTYLYTLLRRYGEAGGYRWQIGERLAAKEEA